VAGAGDGSTWGAGSAAGAGLAAGAAPCSVDIVCGWAADSGGGSTADGDGAGTGAADSASGCIGAAELSISAIIFLTTPGTKIMTHQILNEVENGRYGNAFAYCVILIAIVLAAIGILAVAVGTTTGAEKTTIEGAA